MNLFDFSIPYLSEKIIEMFYVVLMQGASQDEMEVDINDITKILHASAHDEIHVLKIKVNAVARMTRMFKNLRENHDELLQIKMANDGKIPRGLLLAGKPAIRNALKEF